MQTLSPALPINCKRPSPLRTGVRTSQYLVNRLCLVASCLAANCYYSPPCSDDPLLPGHRRSPSPSPSPLRLQLTTRIDPAPVPRLVNPADVVTIGPLFLISNPTSWGWAVAGFGLLTALLRLPPSFRRQCRTPAGRLVLLCPCRTHTADTVGCVPRKHRHKHKHKHKPEHEHEHEHSRWTRGPERQCFPSCVPGAGAHCQARG